MAKLIGTAGHVDHGKTSLIRALTGIDADRLPEEQRRGMTIDIGFAFVDLPVGRVSIVDVPGHERFLTNMLVGALSIDVALLCVAADESVMPQTREHLQILDLLPVDRMVVALTRADLADADTRAIARDDVAELLATTRFTGSPIVEVSAVTGEGLDALREALTHALAGPGAKAERGGDWYLPIDRVFTVKGHGCVVTGTLAQGEVRAGDRGYLQPGNREVRVRAIHSHGESLEAGERGRRTALNLSGVKAEDLRRGMALGAPGVLFETDMLDARVRWITPVKHGTRVRISIGAAEEIGRLFLSDADPEVVQLRLESRVAAALGQPLVVRRYSPPDLLCGGRVAIPQAKRRRKGEAMPILEAGKPEDEALVDAIGADPNGVPTDEVCRILGRSAQSLGDLFERLAAKGRIRGFGGLWFTAGSFADGWRRFSEALAALHEKNPAIANVPRERAVQAAGLAWAGKPLDRILAAMAQEGQVVVSGTAVRAPAFRVQLSVKQRQFLDRVIAALEEAPVNTPNVHRLSEKVPAPIQAIEEIVRLGVQAGEVVALADGVLYTPAQIEGIKAMIREQMGTRPFAASAVRDVLGTSRKYVIPLLEYLDAVRFTTRVGDNRMVNR